MTFRTQGRSPRGGHWAKRTEGRSPLVKYRVIHHVHLIFRVPYLKRKKRNPYRITLLSVRPSVCQDRFSQERVEVSNWNFYMILRSTVPGSCRKINLLSQRNQKIQPFRPQISANFRNSHGNQNLQGTSRELRILKFRTKSRLIVQI